MSYVLVGILLLLVAGAFLTYLVLNATRRSSPARADDGGDGGVPGIGPDDTPLGDTAEHAGETSARGETTGGQDAKRSGGTGRPVLSGDEANQPAEGRPDAPDPGRRFQRDPVGGEAEARPFTEDGPRRD